MIKVSSRGKGSSEDRIDIFGISLGEFKKLISRDDYAIWEEHLRLRKLFENSNAEYLSCFRISTLEEVRRRSFETVSGILEEFGKEEQVRFLPSHGMGHAIRDYLHALILAAEDTDLREAYIRIVAGTLHDVLGCSLVPRFEENGRSIRHAEASALFFWRMHRLIRMEDDEAIPIYYAIAAHTNYLEGMTITDGEGRKRKIEPYKKCHADGQPIYFIHAIQEVDRLDILGPCGFFRHCFSIQEAVGRQFYFGPAEKFFPVDFERHMRPLLRSSEEIRQDAFGATAREGLFSIADTQKGDNAYVRWDGEKMIKIRDSYRDMMYRILAAFDSPVGIPSSQKEMFFFELREFITQRIEPTEEAARAILCFQEMFLALPAATQEAWFSAFRAAMDEYQSWREIFQGELSRIPEEILSLPILGKTDWIVK